MNAPLGVGTLEKTDMDLDATGFAPKDTIGGLFEPLGAIPLSERKRHELPSDFESPVSLHLFSFVVVYSLPHTLFVATPTQMLRLRRNRRRSEEISQRPMP